MRDPDGRVGRVDVLSARAARSVGVDLEIARVDVHFDVVANVHVVGHIALGEEYLTFLSAIKIQAEIDLLDYSECCVVSEFKHGSVMISGVSVLS